MALITIDEDLLIDIESALTVSKYAATAAKYGAEVDPKSAGIGIDMILEQVDTVLPRLQAALFGPQEVHNATER